MFRPINPDRSFSGVNLAESFAEKYSKKYGVDVGLICCADGGTSLDQWQESGLLFDNAVYNAELANRTSTIAGVLWHQEEADCSDELCCLYREKFERIMGALRKRLNLYDVPFLLGGLGDFLVNRGDGDWKNYTLINEQMELISEKNLMTGYVPAVGLTANPDNLHFNAKSLYEFGHRYFEVFEELRDENKAFVEKNFDNIRSDMETL